MSIYMVLSLLSPLLLLIFVTGIVIIVALTQAAEADVPHVFERCANILRELGRRVPRMHGYVQAPRDEDRVPSSGSEDLT